LKLINSRWLFSKKLSYFCNLNKETIMKNSKLMIALVATFVLGGCAMMADNQSSVQNTRDAVAKGEAGSAGPSGRSNNTMSNTTRAEVKAAATSPAGIAAESAKGLVGDVGPVGSTNTMSNTTRAEVKAAATGASGSAATTAKGEAGVTTPAK
jgi:hypothetical protein